MDGCGFIPGPSPVSRTCSAEARAQIASQPLSALLAELGVLLEGARSRRRTIAPSSRGTISPTASNSVNLPAPTRRLKSSPNEARRQGSHRQTRIGKISANIEDRENHDRSLRKFWSARFTAEARRMQRFRSVSLLCIASPRSNHRGSGGRAVRGYCPREKERETPAVPRRANGTWRRGAKTAEPRSVYFFVSALATASSTASPRRFLAMILPSPSSRKVAGMLVKQYDD